MQEVVKTLGRRANLIHYWVPHREQDLTQSSPLQGFTPDVTQAAPCYSHIATLPKSIPELLGGNHGSIAYRMVSEPYAALPVQVDQMETAFELLKPFCSCMWSCDDEIAALVDTFIATRPEPILHISSSGNGNSMKADDVKRITIRDHVLRLLEYRASQGYQVRGLFDLIRVNDRFERVDSDLPYYGHLITQPNERALQAVGFVFQRKFQLANMDNEPYFDALRSQVDPVFGVRASFTKKMQIFTDPSLTNS